MFGKRYGAQRSNNRLYCASTRSVTPTKTAKALFLSTTNDTKVLKIISRTQWLFRILKGLFLCSLLLLFASAFSYTSQEDPTTLESILMLFERLLMMGAAFVCAAVGLVFFLLAWWAFHPKNPTVSTIATLYLVLIQIVGIQIEGVSILVVLLGLTMLITSVWLTICYYQIHNAYRAVQHKP